MSRGEVVTPGVCRVCGCTDLAPCVDEESCLTCAWVDPQHTLCDNVQCIGAVPLAEFEFLIAAN